MQSLKNQPVPIPRILIAGVNSGAGKTTVTLGVMAALKKRGLIVQGFKCGPDYIDLSYHTAVSGRQSRNLDSWFVKPARVKQIFIRNSRDADISIIEGVMGLFDGRNASDNRGSTAEISQIISTPVILTINARSMARSAAAIVRGFQVFSKKTKIVGVIANNIGSKYHLEIIREAVEKECQIPLLGAVLRDEQFQIPERHLGLLPAMERGELNPFFQILAQMAENSIDLDMLMELANSAKNNCPVSPVDKPYIKSPIRKKISVAVARDAAFNFYYPENLEIMQQAGMDLVFFSPLRNEPVPEGACGLYLGGGFPEEFAALLSKNTISQNSIRDAIENGMPTIAECGGFMYLAKEIVDKEKKRYFMAGILPGSVTMQNRLAALGYREVTGLKNNFLLKDGEVMLGHEFHYSTFTKDKEPVNRHIFNPAYHMKGRNMDSPSGYIYKNLIAGYAHFYFLSNPKLVLRWSKKCFDYRD
ncbi:MAG: cobyrinate a,c-diamide synthase [Spirochaetia bacterium]|nr:cobyrinate a,c-diamide synthase [Spirochaetia bacterium]